MASKSDFILKFERAWAHLEELEAQLTIWTHSGHHSVSNEPDPESGSDCFRPRVVTDPVPTEPFSIIIGDVLHNLRSTLDHLAYALAAKHTSPLPDDIAKTSEFPIFAHDDADAIARRIRGIHPGAQAIIKMLQPYHRGKDFALDRLWMLHELSNIDKHRLLIAGTVSNVAAGFRPGASRNFQLLNTHVYDTMIEGEAIVARYSALPIDPNQEMHVEFDPLLQIAFYGPSAVKGKGVIRALRDIHDYIGTRVFGLLGKFL